MKSYAWHMTVNGRTRIGVDFGESAAEVARYIKGSGVGVSYVAVINIDDDADAYTEGSVPVMGPWGRAYLADVLNADDVPPQSGREPVVSPISREDLERVLAASVERARAAQRETR